MEQTVQHLLASAGSHVGRLEVLEGPTGRRTLPDEVKAQTVAESIETGGIIVRVPVDISGARLGDIVRFLRLT